MIMRMFCRRILLINSYVFASTLPAAAIDFGNADGVKAVRKVVDRYAHPIHASVSHDWALCTAFSEHSDLSIVLHQTAPNKWSLVQSDGGAYVAETLAPLGVPKADIPSLLKAYQ